MATKWTSPTWRMPEESNQSKFENYSLDFDGTNDYIDCTDNDMLSFGNGTTDSPFSFFIWAKFGNITTNCFISKQTTGTSNSEYGFTQSGDTIETTFAEGVGTRTGYLVSSTTVSPSLITGQWYHIGFTYAGGSNPSTGSIIYVNGVAQSMSYTVSSYTAMSNNSAPVKIGELSGSVGTYNFNGDLAQGCFFGYELAQSQIDYLYNSGTPVNPMAISGNAPIAYYPLGGSSTGSATTLTVPNGSVPSATVFDFIDGNDTFIDCGANENILDFSGNNYTVSTWVNWDGTGDSNQMIASVKSSGTAVDFVLTIEQSSGKISYWNGSAYAQSNSAIPTGAWCMVTIIVKAGQKDFFINGVADGTPLQARSASATAGTKFLIGKSNYGSEFFNGKVSNLQIWNSTLSTSEITTLYNNGAPLMTGTQPQAANLKAWYKMGIDTSIWNNTQNRWQISNSQASYLKSFNMNPLGIQATSSLGYQDGTNAFSGGAWVNIRSSNQYIMSRQRGRISSTGAYPGWTLRTVGSGGAQGDPQFQIETNGDGNVRVKSLSYTLQDGLWHFVAFTYDGSRNASGIKIYVDGYEDTNRQVLENNMTGTVPNYSTPFMIGGSYRNNSNVRSGSNQFMSNAMYFESELSATDILTLYNNGQPLSDLSSFTSLKGWWKLDDNATYNNNIWTIPDASGNGNEGTSDSTMGQNNRINLAVNVNNGISSGMTTANLVNSDLTSSIPYSSYSMAFDGAAEDIRCGNSLGSSLSQPEYVTVSCWVYFNNIAEEQGLWSFRSGDNANDIGTSLSLYDSGATLRLAYYEGGNNGYVTISDPGFSNENWYNIVCVYDKGAAGRIYINGQAQTVVDSGVYSTVDFSSDNFYIGSYYSSTYATNGNLSNIAVWNLELTSNQVLTVYNGGAPNDISSLSPIRWWSLSGDSYFDGNNFICPNLTSSSNDGTSHNLGSTDLIGNGPGSTANGIATGMNIPANLQGNAPNSTKNAFSINMTADDKTSSVPDISS